MTDNSGEGGIRTPGPVTVNGFQDRRIRPLCHLSAANVQVETIQSKINQNIIFNDFLLTTENTAAQVN